jgi:hypothetical protein
MTDALVNAIENNAAHQQRPTLQVFHPCDGCGPTVRAAEVWVLPSCPCHQLRWLLTFCGHCSRLQTPALTSQGWSPLEDEATTR